MDFAHEGPSWPHHGRSRFVEAGGQRWHVQHWPGPFDHAPAALLIHGTGASTHSWRDVAPLLADRMAVVAADLPGHGFSDPAPTGGGTLPGMAAGLRALLRELRLAPQWLVGHSAGAAIAAQMALDEASDPIASPLHGLAPGQSGPEGALQGVVSLNGALLPLHGWAGQFFSPLARLLALNPLVPRVVAWHGAEQALVARLLAGTGSSVDAAGVELYRRLVRDPGHVAGALAMMARWELEPLAARLRDLPVPLYLVVGNRDRTVPPSEAARVQQLMPGVPCTTLAGLGHLAHEEAPAAVAALLVRIFEGGNTARSDTEPRQARA